MTVREFASRLKHVKPKPSGGYTALCPAHDDHNNSLSVDAGEDGRVLVKCFAGCALEAIVKAMRLNMSDLFADLPKRENGTKKPPSKIVATYDFVDEGGRLLYQEVRYEPKDFSVRRPDGNGGWIWHLECSNKCKCETKLSPVRRVLYQLPEVLKASFVLVVEGPKDCQTACRLGLVATTNAGGANSPWLPAYTETLRGKPVCLIADADAPGLAHTKDAARSLVGVAQRVKLIEALPSVPYKGDLTDYVQAGGTRESLMKLIDETPELTAADVAKWMTPKPSSGFTLIPIGELLAEPDTPVDYLVENMLVSGTVSAVVAKPKVGKSTFARNMCSAVSRGLDFLGMKTKKGECIYLALEELREEVKRDFRALGGAANDLIFVHAAPPPAEATRELCDLMRKRRPALVVGDPLFRLAHIKEEKAYAETYEKLGPLIDAARETGTHLMLCHHSGKSLKVDAIDSPLGSTAIGGAVSTLIVLKRTEAYRTLQTFQRIGPWLPETILQFDGDTHRLSLGGTRLEADRQECEAAILSFLEGAPDGKTEPEVTEGVEGNPRVVRQALRELVKQGKVTRHGEGKRGSPYVYFHFSFSCSQDIVGTREQETQEHGATRMDTARNLVPILGQKSFLVPENSEVQKSQVLISGTGPIGPVERPSNGGLATGLPLSEGKLEDELPDEEVI